MVEHGGFERSVETKIVYYTIGTPESQHFHIYLGSSKRRAP